MKRAVVILQILILFTGMNAQDNGIMLSFGGAGYRMDDLKYYLEQNLNTYPVEGKIVTSFPPYSSISLNLFKKFLPQLKVGAGYGFTSTGGRSSYTDYSGQIYTDIIANSHRIGAFVYYSFLGNEHIDLSLYGRLDANFTRVDLSTKIFVLGFSNGGSNQYKSFSPNGSAGIELMYHFAGVSLGLNAGYLVDKPGKLKGGDYDYELKDPADQTRTLTSDWTGWRAGISAIFWFNK